MPTHIIQELTRQLISACKDPGLAQQEAWWLLEAATNKSKFELLTSLPQDLDSKTRDKLNAMVAQRVHEHQPLQYILGTVPFCGLTIHVRTPILIPRPETEEWVTWLIDQYKQAGIKTFTALDLCTGSGCIALAIAKHFPQATVLGIDLNPEAVQLATINKNVNNITNASFIRSDMYESLPKNFSCNLIVSNPPYLSPEEYNQLDTDVRRWEDPSALVGGHDGMIFYHKILSQAQNFLKLPANPNIPNVVMEIGPAQETHLEQLLKTLTPAKYMIHQDLQGKPRWGSLFLAI